MTPHAILALAVAVCIFAAVPGPAILACASQALAIAGIIMGDVIGPVDG